MNNVYEVICYSRQDKLIKFYDKLKFLTVTTFFVEKLIYCVLKLTSFKWYY